MNLSKAGNSAGASGVFIVFLAEVLFDPSLIVFSSCQFEFGNVSSKHNHPVTKRPPLFIVFLLIILFFPVF